MLEIEPCLKRATARIAGGLHFPDDETGDSHKFSREMVTHLTDMGVDFHFDTQVNGLVTNADRIEQIQTARGPVSGDAYVVALGPFASALMRPLGINLPIYPVKGYSITADIVDEGAAPRSSVMDEHSKLMITRLGNRLRVAGSAEITGFDKSLSKASVDGIITATRHLFPDAINYEQCDVWCGFRPMTPDGRPRLGRTNYRNLFLNAGHGSNGWTQACGASKIVADILSGKEPDIDISGLTYM